MGTGQLCGAGPAATGISAQDSEEHFRHRCCKSSVDLQGEHFPHVFLITFFIFIQVNMLPMTVLVPAWICFGTFITLGFAWICFSIFIYLL
jgi:hypothetical protein